jgi:NAD(P)H-dependent FMN reductase
MNPHTETVAMSDSKAATNPSGFRWTWLLYLGLAAVLIAAAKYFHVQDLLKQALDWVGQLGPWGPVIVIAIYVSIAGTLGATCAILDRETGGFMRIRPKPKPSAGPATSTTAPA